MKLSHTVSLATATALCSAAAVPAALGGGEAKNSAPFTRPAAAKATSYLGSVRISASSPLIRVLRLEPEAKNGFPFTRKG